jgi:hypothetical protein
MCWFWKRVQAFVPNLWRIMGTELPKTADGDPLLERVFQATMRRVSSFSEKFHPCVQKPSALE